MRGDADEANTLNEDERDPLVSGDLLRCLTNEVQRRAKRVRCNAGLGRPWSGVAAALSLFACLPETPGLGREVSGAKYGKATRSGAGLGDNGEVAPHEPVGNGRTGHEDPRLTR
jgi:hypothetical protein